MGFSISCSPTNTNSAINADTVIITAVSITVNVSYHRLCKHTCVQVIPPVVLHEGNIYQEGGGQSSKNNDGGGGAWKSSLTLLLPEYIDECIGTKYLLRPNDATGFYNMKLVCIDQSLVCLKIVTFIYLCWP